MDNILEPERTEGLVSPSVMIHAGVLVRSDLTVQIWPSAISRVSQGN